MNQLSHLRHDRTRRGYSLIEMLIVISMSAVATGVSLVCISTMLKGERLTASALQECQVVARLRQTWSDDVHLAREWRIDSSQQEGATQCELSLKDGRKVRYRSSNWGVLRQVRRTGGPEEHGIFQFPEGTRIQFHQVEEAQLARLKVLRPSVDSNPIVAGASESSPNILGSIVMTFDAVPGRDVRLIESLQAQREAK